MSCSMFLMTNEIPTTTDRYFHHGLMTTNNRSNATLPIVTQSSTIKPTNTLNIRNNPRVKRKLRVKRRSTGIHPDEASIAGTSTEGSANEDDDGQDLKQITELNESFDDDNRTISSSNSIFTIRRIRSSIENLSITDTDSYKMTSTTNTPTSTTQVFLPEEFILRRVDSSISDNNSRSLEERIGNLESLVYDKDALIHDLQRKVDKLTHDLNDAEDRISMLHREKMTLIKAFTALQENKNLSGNMSNSVKN